MKKESKIFLSIMLAMIVVNVVLFSFIDGDAVVSRVVISNVNTVLVTAMATAYVCYLNKDKL